MDAGDCLMDPYHLLFKEYFDICLNKLNEAMHHYNQTKNWKPIEATLFAVSCVADVVKEEQLGNLFAIIKLIQKMPDVYQVKMQCIAILGKYSEYVGKVSLEFVVWSINYVMQAISMNSSTEMVCAKAFSDICEKNVNALEHNHALAEGLIHATLQTLPSLKVCWCLMHTSYIVDDNCYSRFAWHFLCFVLN